MEHVTFYWGSCPDLIFPGWPGRSIHMYVLALALVFWLSVLVEWLSHARFIANSGMDNFTAGILQTAMYATRVGLVYVLMLAVMSYNVGVLLVAIFGYWFGFLVYGSRVFERLRVAPYQKPSDLPPLNCC